MVIRADSLPCFRFDLVILRHVFWCIRQYAAEFARKRWELEHLLSREHSKCSPPPRALSNTYRSPEILANLFQNHSFVKLEQELDYLEKLKLRRIRTVEVWPTTSPYRHVYSAYSVTGRQESWHASSQHREECISVCAFDENNEIESASIHRSCVFSLWARSLDCARSPGPRSLRLFVVIQ